MQKPNSYKVFIHVGFTSTLNQDQKQIILSNTISWPTDGESVKIIFSPDNNALQLVGATGTSPDEIELKISKSLLIFVTDLAKIGLVVKEFKYEIVQLIVAFRSRDSSPKRK